MSSTVNETERKYAAPAGRVIPRLDSLPQVAGTSGPQEQVLEAEYYDTDDLRLLRNGITLRRRRGGSDPGWHLKLPLGGAHPARDQAALGRGGRRVPAELARLVRGLPAARSCGRWPGSIPAARCSRWSTRPVIRSPSWRRTTSRRRRWATRPRSPSGARWSVELTGGGPELLKDADVQAAPRRAPPSARTAKLERALAGQLSGWRTAAPAMGSGSLPGRVCGRGRAGLPADQQAARLKSLDPMVRRRRARCGAPDAGGYARRLRSTLRSFGQVIPRPRRPPGGWPPSSSGSAPCWARLATARCWPTCWARLRDARRSWLSARSMARVQGHFAPGAAEARARRCWPHSTPSGTSRCSMSWTSCSPRPRCPRLRRARPPRVLPAAVRRPYRRHAGACAVRGAHGRASPRTWRCTRRARRPSAPATPARRSAPAHRQPGPAVRQADEAGPVRPRRSSGRRHRPRPERELGIGRTSAGENAFSYGLLYEREAELAGRLKKKANAVWADQAQPHFRRWAS